MILRLIKSIIRVLSGRTDRTDNHFPVAVPSLHAKLRAGAVSVKGNYREHNEDNYYIPGQQSIRYKQDADSETSTVIIELPNVFIVADGMGGQQAGERASSMAVGLIPKAIAKRLDPRENDIEKINGAIRGAIIEANQEILGASASAPELSGMGTTVAIALFHNDQVFISWAGDSRVYRLRAGLLEQITRDQSIANALVKAGTITSNDLPTHPFRNVLYSYLGSKEAQNGPEEIVNIDIQSNDQILMASDGLTSVITEDEIIRAMSHAVHPHKTAQKLVNKAITNNSKDNITCMIIQVIPENN